jgi:hypothetical protein
MQVYSDPSRESDPHALPDVEVFQLTAREAALSLSASLFETFEEDVYEFSKRHEFRLWSMNSKVREAMFDAMFDELGITGGWYYWMCFPGCLPDSEPVGPFATADEAMAAAQEDAAE